MILERSQRSTLCLTETDELVREYHDTGRRCAVPIRIDDHGVVRLSGNRSLDRLVERAHTYRGRGPPLLPPAHIRRAAHRLLQSPPARDIHEFARRCGVLPSTAWSYLCRTLEFYPSTAEAAVSFVYPPLVHALHHIDTSASLREVMERLSNGPLRGDYEWRCIEDRYAHLRLARLCLACVARE